VLAAAFWLLALPILAVGLRPLVIARGLAPDYIQFWSASNIVLEGGNPYDPTLQARYSADQGWRVEVEGAGHWAYLPYYYPPWLALALTPLVPLGFATAKCAWFAMLVESVVLAAWLLRRAGPQPTMLVGLCLGFGVWPVTLSIGQTAPLVVLLVAAAWRLLKSRHDLAAGAVLAWLSIKPQLAGLMLMAICLWALRQRRPRVVLGLAGMGALLVAGSELLLPGALAAMLKAPQVDPLVTIEQPWLGASWWSFLAWLPLPAGWRMPLYLAVALPAVAGVARAAWDRRTPPLKLLGISALATFGVAPYLRYYDLPILLIPLLELVRRPVAGQARAMLAAACVIVPTCLWLSIVGEPSPVVSQLQWLWIVAATAVVWLHSSRPLGSTLEKTPATISPALSNAL